MTLDQYLRENALTEADFAAKVGTTQPTIHRARKPGGSIPSPDLMAAIFEETKGRVRPDDFYGVAGQAEYTATPSKQEAA